ncbi:hypothetical protein LJC63_09860 [Ruminococcaceae bacterium OttesenSCG-928-L11]|nr:hypothetical protein [Ruminococcaceae bacterium OttesenSCG-928-L11]
MRKSAVKILAFTLAMLLAFNLPGLTTVFADTVLAYGHSNEDPTEGDNQADTWTTYGLSNPPPKGDDATGKPGPGSMAMTLDPSTVSQPMPTGTKLTFDIGLTLAATLETFQYYDTWVKITLPKPMEMTLDAEGKPNVLHKWVVDREFLADESTGDSNVYALHLMDFDQSNVSSGSNSDKIPVTVYFPAFTTQSSQDVSYDPVKVEMFWGG